MRGKLRDKRTTSQKEAFYHEDMERRLPYKRISHLMNWQDIEDEEYDLEEEALEDTKKREKNKLKNTYKK